MPIPGILASKLNAPRIPQAAIPRGPLVRRLTARRSRLALLCAPAGYGKTTLARQWVEGDGRPFGWLTLDEVDDDPVVLFRHVVAALSTVVTMTETLSLVEGSRRVDVLRGMAALELDLAKASSSFVIVIDDVETVTSGDSLALLQRVLQSVPDGSTACLASRKRPPIRLGRRQLQGELLELSGADLAFSPAECRRVLRGAAPDLGDGLEDSLLERCDGWPAAVGLAALAVSNGINTDTLRDALATADPVTSYLREEMLDRLGPADRDFLVGTSVLGRVHSGLCDALLERIDSGETLERLVDAGNLFVIGYDDRGTWYRYHPLFRDLLITELRAHGSEKERALHRRAVVWLRDHAMLDDAIAHALAAGDRVDAAGIAYLDVFQSVDEGRTATLERRLREFTVPETLQIPELALIGAAVAGMAGRPGEVSRWMQVVDAFDPGQVLSDGTTAAVGSAAVQLITGHGGAKASLDAAAVILALGPTATPWWAVARLVGVISELVLDTLDEPIVAFKVLVEDVRDSPVAHAIAAAHCAVLTFLAGDEAEGHVLTEAAVESARRANLGDSPMMAVVSSTQALSAATGGRVDEAHRSIGESNRLLVDRGAWNARGQIFFRLVLAETGYRLRSDDIAAQQLRLARVAPPVRARRRPPLGLGR